MGGNRAWRDGLDHCDLRHGRDRSGGHNWQADRGIIAQPGDGFQTELAGALNAVLALLSEREGADEAADRRGDQPDEIVGAPEFRLVDGFAAELPDVQSSSTA